MRSGGYGFPIDDWTRLQRFLILGTERGTYYATERELTREAAGAVMRCALSDPERAIHTIVDISGSGRAPKNDPAIFALAMVCSCPSESTRRDAYRALSKVARTGTHLFHFVEYRKAFSGLGGNGFKRALGKWYAEKDARSLGYQLIKYQQRDGWSHRDVLRLAHTTPPSAAHSALFRWAVKGAEREHKLSDVPEALRQVWAFERAKHTDDKHDLIRLIIEHKLPHECVRNEFKNDPDVWRGLLQDMPLGATLRQLGKLTSIGLLTQLSECARMVAGRLTDVDRIRRARLHPLAILSAFKVYASGRGIRGKLTWHPVARILNALNDAFYLSFGCLQPTGKRIMLALDVSGSMSASVSGMPHLSCREAAAAMALVIANVEPNHVICGFTGGANPVWYRNPGIRDLSISPRQRIDDVAAYMAGLPFGPTDCALPFAHALVNRSEIDAFVVITDNESWIGQIHPHQAIQAYRQKMGVNAKAAYVAMAANDYSLADPTDAGQMDFCGFDTSAPGVLADFISQ